MKLGRWAGLIAGSLLAVSAIAMTGNAAYADDKVPSLDVNGADTIVPGTPYDVQFVFTNDKARDLSKGAFGFVLANYDIDHQDAGTIAFKPGDVTVKYKAGSAWKTVNMEADSGDATDPADPGLLFGGIAADTPSATDKTTDTYEFSVTLHAPSTLQTLSVGGLLLGPGASEKTLVKKAITPKAAKSGAEAPDIWAAGDKVLTVQQPSASPTPTTPANAGGGGSLPTTGASTGVLVAGGVLLLVAGAGVTVATRRRRTANGRHAG